MSIVAAVYILISYLVGSIPVGVLLAKFYNADIQNQGSGNMGATNMTRVLGKKLGALTLVLDMAKSFLVVFGASAFGFSSGIICLVALAVLLGNCFSIFLKGKGGKGVATTFGVYLAISVWVCLVGALVYIVGYGLSRISAVGSLAAAIAWPIASYVLIDCREYLYVSVMISIIVAFRHKTNIGELIDKFCKNDNF